MPWSGGRPVRDRATESVRCRAGPVETHITLLGHSLKNSSHLHTGLALGGGDLVRRLFNVAVTLNEPQDPCLVESPLEGTWPGLMWLYLQGRAVGVPGP